MAAGGKDERKRKADEQKKHEDEFGDFGVDMEIDTSYSLKKNLQIAAPAAAQAAKPKEQLVIAEQLKKMPGNNDLKMTRYAGQTPFIRPMLPIEKDFKVRDDTRHTKFDKIKVEEFPQELDPDDAAAGEMTKMIGRDSSVFTMFPKTMIGLDVTQTPKGANYLVYEYESLLDPRIVMILKQRWGVNNWVALDDIVSMDDKGRVIKAHTLDKLGGMHGSGGIYVPYWSTGKNMLKEAAMRDYINEVLDDTTSLASVVLITMGTEYTTDDNFWATTASGMWRKHLAEVMAFAGATRYGPHMPAGKYVESVHALKLVKNPQVKAIIPMPVRLKNTELDMTDCGVDERQEMFITYDREKYNTPQLILKRIGVDTDPTKYRQVNGNGTWAEIAVLEDDLTQGYQAHGPGWTAIPMAELIKDGNRHLKVQWRRDKGGQTLMTLMALCADEGIYLKLNDQYSIHMVMGTDARLGDSPDLRNVSYFSASEDKPTWPQKQRRGWAGAGGGAAADSQVSSKHEQYIVPNGDVKVEIGDKRAEIVNMPKMTTITAKMNANEALIEEATGILNKMGADVKVSVLGKSRIKTIRAENVNVVAAAVLANIDMNLTNGTIFLNAGLGHQVKEAKASHASPPRLATAAAGSRCRFLRVADGNTLVDAAPSPPARFAPPPRV
eukprot:gene9252-451_t